ncbi:MAG: hypothetical protein Q8O46_04725 [bacterium]|nr:hypothetical protein [bacterium]
MSKLGTLDLEVEVDVASSGLTPELICDSLLVAIGKGVRAHRMMSNPFVLYISGGEDTDIRVLEDWGCVVQKK